MSTQMSGRIGIAERIERLPFSKYQKMIWAIIASAWVVDSIDLAMTTFIFGSMKNSFHLTTVQTGLIASFSFIGMFFGASLAGLLADKFGRKAVFQWSMVFWGLASASFYFVQTYHGVLALRFLLGFGMGMEFPVAQSLLSEFMPSAQRGKYVALMEGGWPIGFILAGVLAFVLLPFIGWRGMYVVEAIPALIVLVVRRSVPESPRWLENMGRHAEADQVMTAFEQRVMESLKIKELPAPKPAVVHEKGRTGFSFWELWSPQYVKRTIMAGGMWFFILLGYYGLTTWIGALMQAGGYSVTASIGYTLLISVIGAPGFFVSAYLLESIGRKKCIILMVLGAAVAAFLYGTSHNLVTIIIFGSLLQFCQFGFWSVIYAYTPELFPTRARATGAGFANGFGRWGSTLGPYLVGVIIPTVGKQGVFSMGAISFVIAAVIVAVLGVETKGKTLEEISQ